MTNKFIFTASALCILFVLLLLSCDKKVGKKPVVSVPLPAGACDTITYTKHIKPIMALKCSVAGCHVSGNGRVLLGDYTQVKAVADNGQLKTYLIDGPVFMPQGSQLPANEKDLVLCWLNNGKKE